MEQRKKFIVNAAYWAILAAVVLFVVRYLLGLIWPFFLAFIFSWTLTPVVRALTVKCHIKYGISALICLLLFFGVLGGLLLVVVLNIVSWVQDLVSWLPPFYSGTVEPMLRDATAWAEDFIGRLDPDAVAVVTNTFSNIISSVSSSVSDFSVRAVGAVTGWVTKLPGRMLSTVICIISTVFMTVDFHRITAFLLRQMSERTRLVVVKAKESFITVLKKYGKSYGIIMAITFVELSVGLLILQQKNALLLAFLIAFFDIFPVIGAGLFLVPWSIVTLAGGALAKGFGLIALYIIITVIRQILEPRIVGHQVGLHPLVTLMAMLVGTKLFGGIGLLGLPIACAIIKSLDDTGVIHVLRKEGDEARHPISLVEEKK